MNPCSGTMKANKYLTDIVNIFTVNDYVSTVLTTTKRGDGRIYAKNYAKKVDLIVCIADRIYSGGKHQRFCKQSSPVERHCKGRTRHRSRRACIA